MLHTSRTDGLLRCPRRGCDTLLSGVRALTFHLHIHAVGAGSYACVRCGGAFESARELTRHACARRRARGAFIFLVPPLSFRVTRPADDRGSFFFFVIVFFPYFSFLQSAYVASSVHGHASLLQARASERSNRLGKLSSNTHQNTTNERITTNPLPLALVRSPQNIALLLLARERLTKHISDVV